LGYVHVDGIAQHLYSKGTVPGIPIGTAPREYSQVNPFRSNLFTTTEWQTAGYDTTRLLGSCLPPPAHYKVIQDQVIYRPPSHCVPQDTQDPTGKSVGSIRLTEVDHQDTRMPVPRMPQDAPPRPANMITVGEPPAEVVRPIRTDRSTLASSCTSTCTQQYSKIDERTANQRSHRRDQQRLMGSNRCGWSPITAITFPYRAADLVVG
jgi:hypothetical protein